MPIYSYKCGNCGEVFDKLVKAGGNGKVKCVECKSDTQRVFSPVGIIFKGSGFYSTDYKKGSKSAGAADNSPSPSSEKTGDKKQDTIKASSSKEKSSPSGKEKSGK
ncbi:MAG: FmdB family zinc ribbon protein [Candidatus Humimicrobiaceae bacterium]